MWRRVSKLRQTGNNLDNDRDRRVRHRSRALQCVQRRSFDLRPKELQRDAMTAPTARAKYVEPHGECATYGDRDSPA